jgi:hypothetical protein
MTINETTRQIQPWIQDKSFIGITFCNDDDDNNKEKEEEGSITMDHSMVFLKCHGEKVFCTSARN